MTLQEFFASKPRGHMTLMAEHLGITKTWLSLITNGHRNPSPMLAKQIEMYTKGKVKRKDLNAVFGAIK